MKRDHGTLLAIGAVAALAALGARRARGSRSVVTDQGFHRTANPELLESATIKGGRVHLRCYAEPPIYHRVELMLSSTDPLRSMHAQQTKFDEAAGLLFRPYIGRRSSWLRAVRQARKSRKT